MGQTQESSFKQKINKLFLYKSVDDFARSLKRMTFAMIILGVVQFILWAVFDLNTDLKKEVLSLTLSVVSLVLAITGFLSAKKIDIQLAIVTIFLGVCGLAVRIASMIIIPETTALYLVFDILDAVGRVAFALTFVRFIKFVSRVRREQAEKTDFEQKPLLGDQYVSVNDGATDAAA